MTRRILLSDSSDTVSLIALVLLQTDVLVRPGILYVLFEDFPFCLAMAHLSKFLWGNIHPTSPNDRIVKISLSSNLLRPNLFSCRALHSKGASRRGPYLKGR